jgi:hypothetical protein
MNDGVPQFATAEYSGKVSETTCKVCGKGVGDPYYQINGAKVCSNCTQQINAQNPKDSHTAFGRGILYGIGGAILGLTIYVGFALATGLIAGLVSLAVGFLVGKAIVMGSGGVGGRRYQVAAALLTYMAVSLAAVPIAMSQHMKERTAQERTAQERSAQEQGQGSDSAAEAPKMNAAKAVGTLTLIGLASPFLELSDPVHGLIGLVILFVGIRIAWRITAGRQLSIVGPLNNATAAATG